MTVEIDDDKLGLEGTFPRPGWTVLDAVRDRRFTGEVVFDTLPEIRLYADRGNIYLAERSSDPSLGARLVDAGALNATQLEHGAVKIEVRVRRRDRSSPRDRVEVGVAQLERDLPREHAATPRARRDALAQPRQHPKARLGALELSLQRRARRGGEVGASAPRQRRPPLERGI